ncbi:MAG: helix-turn-helix domain-containing protein [Planctomycetes bacterium]|nr:helix-turn-helix domain-containing protein [Planctomycetota bacterium]
MLGIGARTLWTLTNRGAIPSRKIGRSVRYCPAELRAWVAAGCPTEPGAAERVRKAVRNGRRAQIDAGVDSRVLRRRDPRRAGRTEASPPAREGE